MLKIFAISFLFLNLNSNLFATSAADYSITGIIKEASGEPVPYANVILLNQDSVMVKADYSKEDGSFKLINLNQGTYRVKVTSVQFKSYMTPEIEINDQNSNYQLEPILMEPMINELGEVVVKATRPIVDIQPDKTVFNVSESSSATGDDALEILKKAPGVVVDNNDNIMVQGKSGVRIYIDGRPARLSGDDLVNMLRGMQAEGIEAIEIITNPSARYEAEGNAGIINIKLKRNKNLGLNGSVNLGYRRGDFNNYHGTVDLNYRVNKLNIFGNYNSTNHQGFHYEDFVRSMNGYFFESTNDMHWKYPGNHFRAGADYAINNKHLVGILVNGNINQQSIRTESYTPFGREEDGLVERILDAGNHQKNPSTNINTNLNYQYSGEKGTTLMVDLDYGYFYKDGSSNQYNYYLNPADLSVIDARLFRDQTITSINMQSIKADYERNIGVGKISMGFKISDIETDNQFDFYKIEGQNDLIDNDRSNDFRYNEKVDAGYLNYAAKLSDQWQINAGLRIEKTFSHGLLESRKDQENNSVKNDYTDIFPSGGVSWTLNQNNRFSLNYSRRINRPNYQNLNPFEFKLDELTYRRGNPFLRPQYSNNIQLSHSFHQKLNTQISYSLTKDYFAQVFYKADDLGGVFSEQNIADAKNIGLNVNYNTDLTKWWNFFTNINIYYVDYQATMSNEEGEFQLGLEQTTANIYLKNSIMLPLDFSVELSGWYNSPSVWGGTFAVDEIWSMDLGLKKKLFDDKATITMAVSDLFYTNEWVITGNYGGIDIRGVGGNDTRQFKVGMTYRFGNQKVKAARKRSTGLEDEKNRLGNNQQ